MKRFKSFLHGVYLRLSLPGRFLSARGYLRDRERSRRYGLHVYLIDGMLYVVEWDHFVAPDDLAYYHYKWGSSVRKADRRILRLYGVHAFPVENVQFPWYVSEWGECYTEAEIARLAPDCAAAALAKRRVRLVLTHNAPSA